MSKYELSITKDYAQDWTIVDSVRELFQNALDQETVNKDNPMFWNYENGTLKIGNAKSTLSTKSLLLGSSTKSDDVETIGQFGEGYKIATLVLTRLGKTVKFYNYGARELWSAYFKYSKRYETELLVFDVDKKYPWSSVPDNDLTIEIEGITEDEMNDVKNSNLHMQSIENSIKGNLCEVLLDEKYRGKFYVNGLYISEVQKFKYGYNFKPSVIKLDRDRKLVREFDLQWATSEFWSTRKDEESIKLATELISEDYPDTDYINNVSWYKLEDISNSVYNSFKEEYGELAVPVSNQKEAELVPVSYKPIIVSENVVELVKSNYNYVAPRLIYKPTFLEQVEKWLGDYGGNIKREARRELSKLIEDERKS